MGLRKLFPSKVYENLITGDHFESSTEKSNSGKRITLQFTRHIGCSKSIVCQVTKNVLS